MINESGKLAQKEYKTKHDWVRKVIHWKLYKWLKFDHYNKFYGNQSESVLENETHKILYDFEKQTDHSWCQLTRKKTTCQLVDFAVSVKQWVKMKGSETINKYIDLIRELKKKAVQHEGDVNTYNI